MTIKRIGYACKTSCINKKNQIESISKLNNKTTTVAWLGRQSKSVAEQRLWELMSHNIQAAYNLVEYVGHLDDSLKMVRLGSDILPMYTHANWKWFWQQVDVQSYCEKHFAAIGKLARSTDVRLSFHPGQFCCLASDNDDVVARSIEEFEYHCNMVRWMNYGQIFQDFKVNVHISGRRGPMGIRQVYQKLSDEARNCITVENEEITHGLDSCLQVADIIPVVLDIHHHLIKECEYIQLADSRIIKILDSWQGVRPTVHYSQSREDVLAEHCVKTLPDVKWLLCNGYNKQKLRAHSDYLWNNAVNTWALSHLEWSDILVEAKAKNLASFAFYEYAKQQQVIK